MLESVRPKLTLASLILLSENTVDSFSLASVSCGLVNELLREWDQHESGMEEEVWV
jgi:hypothetical protein